MDWKWQNQTVTIIRDGKEWTRVQRVLPFWKFLQGLLIFRKLPGEGINGLICYPCKFVYMFGTGFAIDVVYCNCDKEIVYIMDGLVPYKAGPYIKNSCFVLVFPAETVFDFGLRVGERLRW